jgi:peptidoglycan/LPS O-acetylase OafA/YrhL
MSFHSTHKKPGYRPDIDGLRAVAVLAVVLYHAGIPGFSGGFVGVDIFFVISGFLITGIAWPEMEGGEFSLQDFYIRRIKRIFPALFALLFASSIAAVILLVPEDLTRFGQSANSTILFSANFHWLKNTNYFDAPARENPLLHTWSLSVEEQFYAVWPLVLLLLSRSRSRKKLLYVIAGLALISLVLGEARLSGHPKDSFYFPWCRAWELLAGASLAVSPSFLRPGRLATALAGLGFLAIASAVAFYEPSMRFPGLTAVLPCAGAGLIIAAGSLRNPVSRILASGPARHVGLVSYSLYLVHWPLFSFAHIYVSQELSLGLRLSLVLASLALASASWRFIEMPARKAELPNIKVFGTAAAATALLYVAGTAFYLSGGLPFRVDKNAFRVDVPVWELSKYCRSVSDPAIRGAIVCAIGEEHGSSYDFIIWGDSHAKHFVPAIATLAKDRKLSGLLFSRPACHPFLEDSHTSADCRDHNATVARWAGDHAIKVAILAGRWVIHDHYLERFISEGDPIGNSGGLARTLAFLANKGVRAAVLDQVPDFPMEVRSCIERSVYYNRDTAPCVSQPAATFEARHKILTDYFAFLKRRYEFSFSSAAKVTCGQEQCLAKDGNTLLMSDSHHLTEAGALRTIPCLNIPLLTGAEKRENAAAPTATPAAY